MLEYDFSKRKPDSEKTVFALTLSVKKMTERIVIGEVSEVRRQLKDKTGKVHHDQTRPLGQLLLNFETDKNKQWDMNISLLRESYKKIFPFEIERWKIVSPVADFLRSKYASGEPAAMYAAIRTWEDYLECYNVNHGADVLASRLDLLYRPFSVYAERPLCQMKAADAMLETVHDGESQVELWYPMAKRPFECVVAFSSLQPLICYYLHKIEEWNFVFQKCKVCDKYFLTQNRYYRLCSDECRRVQAVQAKREFDARIKDDSVEQYYQTAYHYWYNRLRKLRGADNVDADKLSVISEAFEIFKKEAVKRKDMVKRGEFELREYSEWLVGQQDEVDVLVGEKYTVYINKEKNKDFKTEGENENRNL